MLTRKPVVIVPYIWTPSIVEHHKNENNLPLWIQFQSAFKDHNKVDVPWSPHIFETNVTSTSSCTIPLLILKQAKEHVQYLDS